ncbi:MAG: DUF3592 domain-containing protein [Verrucomicrobiaceae bacterium]
MTSSIIFSTTWFATVSTSPLLQVVLIGTAVALIGLLYFLRRFGAAWSMKKWCRTQGRVITAEMRRGRKKNSDGCWLYDPVLRYSYAVGDRTFESSNFTHRAVNNAANLAAQFISRIQKGAEVPVYYHPHNPAQSVVQPMPWQGSATGAAMCAVLLLALVGRLLLA